MRNVSIISSDSIGIIGLDLGYSGQIGPLFIQYLYIYGFNHGINIRGNVDSMTLEHIYIDNPTFCGLCNYGQVVMTRNVCKYQLFK